MKRFITTHKAIQQRIERYIERPRWHYAELNYDHAEHWNPKYLNAGSPLARIRFARIVFEACQKLIGDVEDLYFITVNPVDYVLPLDQAASVNICSLKALGRQAIGSRANMIGMIEAALFKEWGRLGPSPRHDSIAWHVHMLVWNTTRRELDRAAQTIERHVNLQGRRAVHIMKIAREDFEAYLLYILKMPIKEYRLNRLRGERIDQETGEVFHHFRQQKRELRTGDRVRLLNIFENLDLDDLIFGQHEGSRIVRQIKDAALRQWRAEEHQRESRGVVGWREHRVPNPRGAAHVSARHRTSR